MKHTQIIFLSLIFFFSQEAFAQVPKKIVVEHFTNTNCGNCASRNPGFYTNLNSQSGVLHLAVHPSAPYAGCLLYQQNATDNDARTNYYGIYGSTPRLVINGNVISSGANYSSSAIFTPYQSLTSPASIRIVQEKFGTDSIRATVIIKTEATHSLGGLSLFVALAEDSVFYTGGNGEPIHFDVFRKSLSNVTGTSVTLPSAVGDSVVLTYSSASNALWNFSRIYTLAILQETSSKNLVQAEAASVTDGVVSGIENNFMNAIEMKIFPNPANQFLAIQFKESLTATASVFSLDGKFLLQKSFSKKNIVLDIKELPSGLYFLQVENSEGFISEKFLKE